MDRSKFNKGEYDLTTSWSRKTIVKNFVSITFHKCLFYIVRAKFLNFITPDL